MFKLKPQGQTEHEGTGTRIGVIVNAAHFGIQAGIVGQQEQVVGRCVYAQRSATAQLVEIVTQGDVIQPEERTVFQIVIGEILRLVETGHQRRLVNIVQEDISPFVYAVQVTTVGRTVVVHRVAQAAPQGKRGPSWPPGRRRGQLWGPTPGAQGTVGAQSMERRPWGSNALQKTKIKLKIHK